IISALEGYDKPRSELFSLAKQRFPAARYYMVGDNPIADIDGGNAADMTTILVHTEAYTNADYCFDTLSPCIDIFSIE
ncbi:MAG: HAD hydrolase-like protein, partial [Clostridia bacterium]|nr:HAD hydrolase-like protein [Clostridia bacterium]